MKFRTRAAQIRYQFALLLGAYLLGQIAIAFIPVDRSAVTAVADDINVTPSYGGDLQLVPVSTNNDADAKPAGDWAQWGGDSKRNNVPNATNIPIEWDVGSFDRKNGRVEKRRRRKHQMGGRGRKSNLRQSGRC